MTPETSEGKCEQQMERLVVIRMARSQVPCVKTLSPKETGFFPDVANSSQDREVRGKEQGGPTGEMAIQCSLEIVLSRMLTGERSGMDHRTLFVDPLSPGVQGGLHLKLLSPDSV